MNNIAFISIGKQSQICANLLVQSILKTNKNCQILQISSDKENTINGVDKKIIHEFKHETFMINKLESQNIILSKYGPTIFVDSDMLIFKDLNNVFDLLKKKDFVFTIRKNNFLIKDFYFDETTQKIIPFPEFKNKMMNSVMPFNAGFVGARNNLGIKKLLEVCINLPNKYHLWYGDQVAQKLIYESKEFNVSILDSKYNFNIKKITDYNDNTYVFHFKGRFKELMLPFYKKYLLKL